MDRSLLRLAKYAGLRIDRGPGFSSKGFTSDSASRPTAMAKFKPPRRLFGNSDVVHSFQGRRGNPAGPSRLAPNRPDGLQHVEFAFAALAKKDLEVDDRAVLEAIQLALKGSKAEESTAPKVAELRALIESVRETRTNVSDSEWANTLRSVVKSVRSQSGLEPGERDYLDFIGRYLS
jgi:hypothetical protein